MLKQERIEWMEHNMKECPINHTFKLMGKKFTMLIIRNMIHLDHKRFNQFLEIEDINAKVLSARLKEMEKDGLIERFTLTPLSELNIPLPKRAGHLSQYSMRCLHSL